MDVDTVCGETEVCRDTESEEIFSAIDQSTDEILGCESLELLIRERYADFIVSDCI